MEFISKKRPKVKISFNESQSQETSIITIKIKKSFSILKISDIINTTGKSNSTTWTTQIEANVPGTSAIFAQFSIDKCLTIKNWILKMNVEVMEDNRRHSIANMKSRSWRTIDAIRWRI